MVDSTCGYPSQFDLIGAWSRNHAMDDVVCDVFVSHASRDKDLYVVPLTRSLSRVGVSFWLDSAEISWGDSITMQINRGLQRSRYVLLCLSRNYLARPWPEHEMGAALAIQNDSGLKRVWPLICDSKDHVVQAYPILAGLLYRDFSMGPDAIAQELNDLAQALPARRDRITIVLESVHTGENFSIDVPRRATVEWMCETALAAISHKTRMDGLRAGEMVGVASTNSV